MLDRTVTPILKVLGASRDGMTARAVAVALHIPEPRMASTLSKLALYGQIGRTRPPKLGNAQPYRYCINADNTILGAG